MHFSGQKDGSLSPAVSLFNELDDQQFAALMDAMFVVLIHPSKSETLSSVLDEICSSSGIRVDDAKEAANNILSFVIECLKKNLGVTLVEKETAASDLSESKRSLLTEQYARHYLKLSARHLAHNASNSLLDMEWKFGVTASSSEMNTVGHTFLQLKMKIGDNASSEIVHMELSLPEFYNFLHEMERAKANMELCT